MFFFKLHFLVDIWNLLTVRRVVLGHMLGSGLRWTYGMDVGQDRATCLIVVGVTVSFLTLSLMILYPSHGLSRDHRNSGLSCEDET